MKDIKFNDFDMVFNKKEFTHKEQKNSNSFVDFSLGEKKPKSIDISIQNIDDTISEAPIDEHVQESNYLDALPNDLSTDLQSETKSKPSNFNFDTNFKKDHSQSNVGFDDISYSPSKEFSSKEVPTEDFSEEFINDILSKSSYNYEDSEQDISDDLSEEPSNSNIDTSINVNEKLGEALTEPSQAPKSSAFPGAKNVEPMTYIPKVHLEDISDSPVLPNSDVSVDTVSWSNKVNFSNSYSERAKASISHSASKGNSNNHRSSSTQADDDCEIKFCNFSMMAKINNPDGNNNVKKK